MSQRALPVEVVVLWDGRTAFARGHRGGLPVFTYSGASAGLMTRRQLRAAGLSPGRQEPVAVLRFGHRKAARRVEFAALYCRDLAAPSRPATPAQRVALDRAMTVRRACLDCGEVKPYCVPTSTRQCWDCFGDEVDRDDAATDADGRDTDGQFAAGRDTDGQLASGRGDGGELAAAVPAPRTSPEHPTSPAPTAVSAPSSSAALAVGGPPVAPSPRPPLDTADLPSTPSTPTPKEQQVNRDESTTPAGAGAWMQDGESWQDAAARADQEAQGWYRRELDLDPVTDAAEYTAAQQQVDLWVARPISVLPEDLGAPVADGPYPGVGAADPTDHRDARDAAAPAAEQTVGPGDGDGAPRVEHATAVDAAEPVVDPWGMSPQEWEDHPAYQDWVDAEEGVTPRTGVELDAYWERVLADPERRAAFAAALDRSGQAYIEPPPADLGDPWALDECPRAAEPVADAHAACTQAGRAAERLAEADQQTAHAVLRPVAADDDQLDGVDIDTTQER